jgi:hypothetical protein
VDAVQIALLIAVAGLQLVATLKARSIERGIGAIAAAVQAHEAAAAHRSIELAARLKRLEELLERVAGERRAAAPDRDRLAAV